MRRPKLLLPWGATSILGHSLRQWENLQAFQIGIVCAAGDVEIQNELDRLEFPRANRIFNTEPDRGMFSSVQSAAAWPGWKTGIERWVISLGDQPQLRSGTLRTLLEFAIANPDKICQPLRNGRRRHPVFLPRAAFQLLKDHPGPDLKQFLESRVQELAGFESGDNGLDFDIDTPGDYEQAKQLFSGQSA
jgi:molybdenum cofactor cytidylyltransferase